MVPFIYGDCGGVPQEIGTIGCSMGAYHALTFALRRADLFPLSMSFSGNYDPSAWHGWGEQGEAAYFTNPTHFVPGLGGDHLDWLRSRLSVLLVVGQGMWEDTTGVAALHPADGLAAAGEGPPLRAGPVGPRRAARLAVLAAAARPPPAPLLLAESVTSRRRP